jgi:hypothetical protein
MVWRHALIYLAVRIINLGLRAKTLLKEYLPVAILSLIVLLPFVLLTADLDGGEIVLFVACLITLAYCFWLAGM